jgi:hypothetical protein
MPVSGDTLAESYAVHLRERLAGRDRIRRETPGEKVISSM